MKQRFADNSFLCASQRFVAPADGIHEALQVPRNCFIEEVWVEVENPAGAGTAVIDVGIKGGDVDCFIAAAAGDAADGTVFSSKGAAAGVNGDGMYLTAGKIIGLTVAIGTSATQGNFIVYARYTNITR